MGQASMQTDPMSATQIRPAVSSDIQSLIALDHDYSTDHVWQMAFRPTGEEINVAFREVRLPRPMRVSYPRDPQRLIDEWTYAASLTVAESGGALMGYHALSIGPAPGSAWITDLVVGLAHRRQGIGTRLLGAARRWCQDEGLTRMVLEMQSKTYPGICLARKLGFVIAGYHDHYYPDGDIALFFALDLR